MTKNKIDSLGRYHNVRKQLTPTRLVLVAMKVMLVWNKFGIGLYEFLSNQNFRFIVHNVTMVDFC